MRASGLRLRRRVLFLLLVTLVVLVVLSGRLAYLQLVRGEELRQGAVDTRLQEVVVQAPRGDILDREGRPLAMSVTAESIYAVPAMIEDPRATAATLAPLLNMETERLEERLTRQLNFVWLRRQVSEAMATGVKERQLSGIYFTQESSRYYPNDELGAHVLGFVGLDHQGLEGVEVPYDALLAGTPGSILIEFDARGWELPQATHEYVEPKPGHHLVLELDETIQYLVERELDRAISAHNALGGVGVVMEPSTGAIMALATRPAYDPNRWDEYEPQAWRNAAVSDSFSPGSVFKPITAAAALDGGVATPHSGFWDPGSIRVPGAVLYNWDRSGLGDATLTEGIQYSSNVVMAKTGLLVGMERFYEYLDRFGFGQTLGVDLPGEDGGILPAQQTARPVDLAVMSFGQTLTTTPIQMAAAISAIANDGVLMKPRIARELRDAAGNLVKRYEAQALRQAISSQAAADVRMMMQRVVTDGTGGNAAVAGYSTAGKTGTATKVINGRLMEGKYIASFVGFAPAAEPALVVYVAIDEPQGGYFGSQVAAPVFRNIVRDALPYLNIPPAGEDALRELPPTDTEVPNLRNLPLDQAKAVVQQHGLRLETRGQGDAVVDQLPVPGAYTHSGSLVVVFTEDHQWFSEDPDAEPVRVPDVTGMSVRDAAAVLAEMGLRMEMAGSGTSVSQEPQPGTRVAPGTVVHVRFQPPDA